MPAARIYVYDNNSSDLTALRARAAGAIVVREPRGFEDCRIRGERADRHAAVFVIDHAGELAAVLQADVAPGRQLTRFQDDHEIGAAGKWPRAGMPREIVERFGQRVRHGQRVVVEPRDH